MSGTVWTAVACLVLAIFSFGSAGAHQPLTYEVDLTAENIITGGHEISSRATGFIITDGALGTLQSGDIIGFNIRIYDSYNVFAGAFDGADGSVSISGGVSASASGIFFDFSKASNDIAFTGAVPVYFGGATPVFYVNETLELYGSKYEGPSSGIFIYTGATYPYFQTENGKHFEFGVSDESAIAEPAAWVLIVIGVGGLGVAIRRSRALRDRGDSLLNLA